MTRAATLRTLSGGIGRSAHVVAADPGQLAAHLIGRLLPLVDPDVVALRAAWASRGSRRAWLCPLTPCFTGAGGPLTRTLAGHRGPVQAVCVVPGGRRALSASEDGELRLWDLDTGRALRTFDGRSTWVSALWVTADGALAVSDMGARLQQPPVIVWDLDSGEALHVETRYWDTVISPDGRFAASVPVDGKGAIEVWRPRTGECLHVLDAHRALINQMAVTADSRTLVSCSEDTTIRLWDLDSGALVRTLQETEAVRGVRLARGAPRLVAFVGEHVAYFYGGRRTLRAWDTAAGERLGALEGDAAMVAGCDLTPDGRTVVLGTERGSLRFWDPASGAVEDSAAVHEGSVRPVRVDPAGRVAVSAASGDRIVAVWDLGTRACVGRLEGHAGDIAAFDLSDDGRDLITASGDQTVKWWNLHAAGDAARIEAHAGPVNALAVAPAAGCLISGAADRTVRIWDLSTGAALGTLPARSAPINDVSVDPDDRSVVVGTGDGRVERWRLDADEREPSAVMAGTSPVNGVAVLPDGRVLAGEASDLSSSGASCLAALDLRRGRRRGWGEIQRHVNAVAVTADGRLAVVGADLLHRHRWTSPIDGEALQVWNVRKERAEATLRGHTGPVNAVAVTPDGRRALSGSADQTVRAWDLGARRQIAAFRSAGLDVKAVALTPDGRLAASGSVGGTVQVWDLDEAREVARLTLDAHIGALAFAPHAGGWRLAVGDGLGHVALLRLAGAPI